MVFLAWFIVPQAAYLFGGVICFIAAKLRKKTFDFGKLLERYLPSLSFSFLFSLALAVMMALLFPRLSFLPSMGAFLFVSIASSFIDFGSLFSEKKVGGHPLLGGILLLFAVIECTAFNSLAYQRSPYPSASLSAGQISLVEGSEMRVSKDAPLIFKVDSEGISDVYLSIDHPFPGASVQVSLSFSYDGESFAGSKTYTASTWSDNSFVFAVPSEYAECDYVRVGISGFDGNRISDPEYLVVKDISVNVPLAFDFSYVRMGSVLIIGVAIAYISRLARRYQEDKREAGKIPYIAIGGFVVVALVGFFAFTSIDPSRYYIPYPLSQEALDSMADTNIYVRLFDAFVKGQPYLDVSVDPGLLTASNPWDPNVWRELGLETRWDHAYYDGHYYSYYGFLPVIITMFPVYWLSGCRYIPSLITLQAVGMIYAIAGFALLVLEIGRLISKKVHYPSLAFLFLGGLFTSVLFNMMTFKEGYYHEGIYHTPIIYGQAFADIFLAFAIMAYRHKERPSVYLAMSGLSLVMTMASRPNLIFYAVLALPFFFGILLSKERKLAKRIVDFVPMAAIVIVGAIGLCYYNYIRFDNILEFGQSYQMNYDQRGLTYSLSKIYPSFLHFFLQYPVYYDQFPFLSCSVVRYSFDEGFYFSGYLGLVFLPFFYFMFAGPFVGRKTTNPVIRLFVGLFLPVAFAWAFTTYSKAGICARYLAELYHIATLGSIASYLMLMEQAKTENGRKALSSVALAAIIVSSFVGVCLLFDSFDGWNGGDLFGIPEMIKESWWVYNI